jgi:two-component system nitrate/nitrite response regulator NarL
MLVQNKGIIMTEEGNEITTALFCDGAVLRTRLAYVLSKSPFVVAKPVLAVGPSPVDRKVKQPALIIVAAGQFYGHIAEVIRQAKEQFPRARIVALADQFDPRDVGQAYEAGANGLGLATLGREALIASLELVMLGEGMVPTGVAWAMLNEERSSPTSQSQSVGSVPPFPSDPGIRKLSTREAEILHCLMQGASNKTIARKCDVTEATIKVHVKAILRKIGVANRTQAAMWAIAHLPTRAGAPLST